MNIIKLYNTLFDEFEDLNWWPYDKVYHKINSTDHRFEIIVGAILTQNTSWLNVEKALNNLKEENILDIKSILETDEKTLKKLIKPSGFFNQKADRILNFSKYINKNYNQNLNLFFDKDIQNLRYELLSLQGIGPETADSIILYAAEKPIFVVDAYTKRICKRLNIVSDCSYNNIQNYFEKEISKNFSKKEIVYIYNQMHALIVFFAKKYCKKKPVCKNCPIKKECYYYKNIILSQ